MCYVENHLNHCKAILNVIPGSFYVYFQLLQVVIAYFNEKHYMTNFSFSYLMWYHSFYIYCCAGIRFVNEIVSISEILFFINCYSGITFMIKIITWKHFHILIYAGITFFNEIISIHDIHFYRMLYYFNVINLFWY